MSGKKLGIHLWVAQLAVVQPFQNSLPKSVGDPWRGAYSKHGFWYKFHTGGKADFDEVTF
ncbi:hypothetical protein TELCIR_16906 [Teladorsagia circumcincta]|uniref:Uncharacterized protein n=1 Tax=Teladorsagia circumcincta TaxID=45464 RepID=A0A2G9TU75_TELCI|nr:hypothetical protein TELCIR_16906 [Teladorsagia circumcincta]